MIIVTKSIKAADSLNMFKISLSDLSLTDNILKGILRAYLLLMSDMFNSVFDKIFMYLFPSFHFYYKCVSIDLEWYISVIY